MGSTFGAIWKDLEGGFIKFTVKRTLKQDQTLHMEGENSRYSLLQGGVTGFEPRSKKIMFFSWNLLGG